MRRKVECVLQCVTSNTYRWCFEANWAPPELSPCLAGLNTEFCRREVVLRLSVLHTVALRTSARCFSRQVNHSLCSQV